MRVFRLTTLLISFVLGLSAQHTQDSLREIIKTSENDSIKIMAYTGLCNSYINEPKKALEALSEMNGYCEKIKDERSKALGLRKVGAIYSYLNYYDRALEYTYKAADLFETVNDKNGLAFCYNNIGNFYNYKGEFTGDKRFQERSIEYHLKSIALRDTVKDTVALQMSFNNIGNSYMAFGDYGKALTYYLKSYTMAKRANAIKPFEMISENMGNCYMRLGAKEMNAGYYKQALYYFTSVMKNYHGNNPSRTYANGFVSIGYIYSKIGNSSLGISYLQKGLAIAKDIDDKSAIKDAAEKLSEAYEKSGEYAKALELMHVYNANKDSLINEKNTSSTEEMQTLFQTSKKDKEIEKLNIEKRITDAEILRQRTIIFSTVGAVISILVLVLVLWSRFNLKKKANLQLSDAYKKIEIKNQQITDSINYSKRIQSAILPPIDLINSKLNNFFIYYASKDIVSGDFYWFSEHENKLFFIVVDCTGHGVPGALMSMIGNTLLNEIINQKNITLPGEILSHLNKGVKHALRQSGSDGISQDDGMDVSICCIDKSNKNTLLYACANHSIFVKSKNAIVELTGDIYSIGGDFGSTEKSFETKTHIIEPNSFIVMSTDGYYDQFGGNNDSKFLISRFEQLILETNLESKDVAAVLEKAHLSWRGLQKQTDDVLVAGFKV